MDNNYETKTKKENVIPIVFLIILLIGGLGLSFFIIRDNDKVNKEENKTEEKEEEKKEKEKKEEEKKEELELVDTKTTTISLNGIDYELKIDVFPEQIRYIQKVYFNNNLIVDDYVPLPQITNDDDYYKEVIEYELNNINVFKDSSSNEEYLLFTDGLDDAYIVGNYYIVNKEGKLLKKVINFKNYGGGVLIFTNNPPQDLGNYFVKNEINGLEDIDYKYVFDLNNVLKTNNSNITYVKVIFNENAYECINEDYLNKFEIVELSVKNGEAVENVLGTIEKTDNYYFYISGGCV